MINYATSGLNAVRTGLRLKRIGSTLLLISLLLSMLSMSLYIIMAMAAFVTSAAYVLGRGVHGGNSPATIALRSRSTI
jgi:hypothetical protein